MAYFRMSLSFVGFHIATQQYFNSTNYKLNKKLQEMLFKWTFICEIPWQSGDDVVTPRATAFT